MCLFSCGTYSVASTKRCVLDKTERQIMSTNKVFVFVRVAVMSNSAFPAPKLFLFSLAVYSIQNLQVFLFMYNWVRISKHRFPWLDNFPLEICRKLRFRNTDYVNKSSGSDSFGGSVSARSVDEACGTSITISDHQVKISPADRSTFSFIRQYH
jgi:hypothetical protein